MINCLILEDEKPAQEVLKKYIDQTPFLNFLGLYESGLHIPLQVLQDTELLFLDIQLPGMNGLSYVKTVKNPPKVIVTSAYSDYALEAFEEEVVDYLLKPFPYERFFKAVDRIRNQIAVQQQQGLGKNIFVYADKTFYNIQINDILYLKAEADYINIVAGERDYLILDSLRNWNEKLKGFNFLQCHRSYIVNLDKVSKVSGNRIYPNEELWIPIGKTHKEQVLQSLRN